MKKTIAILLALVLTLGAVSCGSKPSEGNNNSDTSADTSEAVKDAVSDPLEVLKKVWETYGEDEKFASAGGDFTDEIVEGPGAYNELDGEVLDNVLGFPAASIDKIDSAASFMHMMNQNTFTSGAYHVKDTANIDTLASDLRDNIQARQWMCGFPDSLIVASVGEVVISAYGKEQFINNFVDKLSAVYPDAKVIITEPIE